MIIVRNISANEHRKTSGQIHYIFVKNLINLNESDYSINMENYQCKE